MAMNVTVEYSVEECEECPYCVDSLGGFPIIPRCIKTNSDIDNKNSINKNCPYGPLKDTSEKIH